DELDGDSAAVAAAAEAEADWEDAGMAAAGVAMTATGLHALDTADETAASDAETEPLHEADLEDEAVIDEAMLRELVAQLVRDELQGTVGERITHNVRKLIRREIARALTLQDFEK
ncbi:MAG TPA: hypothetical protein DIU07_05675, partial [Rhodobacteraceae bacterium]|nr:hypothetical protein [Paracoccaceae bacterium]